MGGVSYFHLQSEKLIRALYSVGGEWIVTKKDWKEAERREKSKERRDRSNEKKERERPPQESNTTDSASTEDTSEPNYTPDMDEQRCILYLHGGKLPFSLNARIVFGFRLPNPDILLFLCSVGGYYFGSVDQERYSIQRFARKINGRVFGESCVSRPGSHCGCHDSFIIRSFGTFPPFICVI